MKVDFAHKRAVGLRLGPFGVVGLVDLVVPGPVEFYGSVITTTDEGPGDVSEGELAAGGLEKNVGRLDRVSVVVCVVVCVSRQLDDLLLAQEAHARARNSLGRPNRL